MVFIVYSQLVSGRSLSELTAVMGMFAVASIRLVPAVSQILCALGQIRFSLFALDMLCMDLKEIERYQKNGQTNDQLGGQMNGQVSNPLSNQQKDQPLPFNYEVALEGITYCYPASDKPAVRDFSLTLRKGESIALVGKSGSGKTTLVDILLGLLSPDQGDIKVDGRSIYSDVRGWQNLLGYIPQSIFFNG